jgi:uncharacterized surface protein with fasciclin (FAS1) repeats
MNLPSKRILVGISLSALLLPIVGACSGQTTTQAPTDTQTAPESTTTPVSPSPGVQGSPATGTRASAKNVVDVIDNNPSLKTLAATIDAADLKDTLEQAGPYTIFAPSDRAFAALPAATRQKLLQAENRPLLRQILTYHVVPGKLTASQLKSGSVKTAAGTAVNVQVNGQKVTVDRSQVTQPDLQAANGVVHIVDRVLLPPNVKL